MEYRIIYSDELYHHGVKGMKWGVRHDPKSTAAGRVAREGGSEYSIHYGRFGGQSIRNASGKKMSYRTRRALEKSIKADDIQKYREMKKYKRAAESGLTYVGNSSSTALMVAAINSATQASRDDAKTKYQKMLINEGNKYVNSMLKVGSKPATSSNISRKTKNAATKDYKKAYDSKEKELYRKNSKALEKATGDNYYKIVDSIQDQASSHAMGQVKNKYGITSPNDLNRKKIRYTEPSK